MAALLNWRASKQISQLPLVCTKVCVSRPNTHPRRKPNQQIRVKPKSGYLVVRFSAFGEFWSALFFFISKQFPTPPRSRRNDGTWGWLEPPLSLKFPFSSTIDPLLVIRGRAAPEHWLQSLFCGCRGNSQISQLAEGNYKAGADQLAGQLAGQLVWLPQTS